MNISNSMLKKKKTMLYLAVYKLLNVMGSMPIMSDIYDGHCDS